MSLRPVWRARTSRLPDGHQASGIGTVRGHHVPFVGGSASSGGMVDYLGAFDDDQGQASMEMQYVAASAAVRFGHMHIPLTELPPGMDPATYAGSTWPFPEPIVLPGRVELPGGTLYQTSSSAGA